MKDTEVINEIKVEASTGNNKIKGEENGQVIEGEAKSSVEVKTIINGEEVQSISTQSDEGSIEVESRIEVDERGTLPTGRQVMNHESPAGIKIWFSNFINSFKSIFKKIFNLF